MTGATGYIGSHVLKYLLSKGWDIHVIADPKFGYANIKDVLSQIDVFEYDGNILSLCEYFQKVKPVVVFHLAAAVITNYKPEQVPVLIQSNIQFGTEVLEAMKYAGTKQIVSTGSYWQNYNSDSYNPVDLYAATKEAYEQILQYYVDAFCFKAVTLRLFDVYGEDDKRPKIWSLLCSIAGTEMSIDVSPGEQKLDLVYIDDVCSAYESAYNYLIKIHKPVRDVFGVSSGKLRTLKELVDILEDQLGKKIKIKWGGKAYKSREVMAPCESYKRLPNWKCTVDVYEGFKKLKNHE